MPHNGCERCVHHKGRKIGRRNFFERISDGLYGVSLATLLSTEVYGSVSPLLASEANPDANLPAGHRRVYDVKPRPPHFEPKVKAVIQLVMNGGPSQVDLFDPKPELAKRHGEAYFDKIANDVTFADEAGALLRSPFSFKQYGKSGIWISELMPHLAEQVDEITVIRSMHTVNPSHELALFMFQSGRPIPGRPTIGAWVVYGLGTQNQNLPSYVVLEDPLGLPVNGIANWQSGFLPPIYQGTRFRSVGSPILNLAPEVEEPNDVVRMGRDLLSRLDRIHKRSRPNQLQLDARIASYELAAQLQMEATDALDLSKESPATLEMYGVGHEPTDSYGRRCLMARRLVERGVRYIQLHTNGQIWDSHRDLVREMGMACGRTDQPVAALIKDLKQRGLLDSTLVIWGGEFGRMPIAQNVAGLKSAGRDHNPRAFSIWMAGGGVKAGMAYGGTDELGYKAVENPVSVTDWQATILHLLGFDYQKLVFEQNGLEEKLTSVLEARIVKEILA